MAPKVETQPKLPVINFNRENLNPGTDTWLSTSHEVRRALENYGCFVLSGYNIPLKLRETIFELSKDLFNLPMETKIKNRSDILGFGYGNFRSMPLWECFGIEDGATLSATESFTNLLYPSGNKDFCESAFKYTKMLSDIDHCVMRMVFDSYGVEAKHCDRLTETSMYLVRIMKYRGPKEGELEMALPPHKDKSFLAILDENDVKGLEIEMRNGDWIYHERSPSTFIVIAGEPFMAWSNGRIYAPLHQVAMRSSELQVIRYTIAIFSFMREKVEVPEELVDDDKHSLQFRPFNHFDFLKYVNPAVETESCSIKAYCGVTTTVTTAK